MMGIRFTGDFKNLIPMGFTFHKLFADNYKVYEKNRVWIWVAHGGYVEIGDLHDLSTYVVKAILDGTYPVYEEDRSYGDMIFFKKGDRKPCLINRKTGEIHEMTPYIIEHRTADADYDYDLFRDVSIYKKTFHFIKEIENMIEVGVEI